MTSPQIYRFPDISALFAAAADRVTTLVREVVVARGQVRLALAGGTTPGKLYSMLATSPWRDRVPWQRIEVFWGDERCVPPDDPTSNYRMAHDVLLAHVPVAPAQVHRMRGEIDPARAVEEYAAVLGTGPLDLALLGMGSDGHTASLFPDTPNLETEQRKVAATRSPVAPFERISLTLPVFNGARAVVFLVTGREKAPRVAEVFGQTPAERGRLPAALVRPLSGSCEWFLDEAAAAALPPQIGSGR